MRIDNEFVVQAPIDRVWEHLLDVERVAPCMPGAQLTEVVDDHTWKGRTTIKVGPVSLVFAGTVVLEERDDAAHRVKLNAKGMEQRGKGAASATVMSRLEEVDEGTKVNIEADLTISGAVAQYGRGMILDISQRLTGEFARCLEASMTASTGAGEEAAAVEATAGPGGQEAEHEPAQGSTAEDPTPPASVAATAVTASPVKGFRLGLWAFWRALVRFFRRLFSSGS
jgi:carbon monoxide dehydrogenase subunit G